jgi:hypothetical protein
VNALPSRFRRRPQVLFRAVGDEMVLAPPGRQDFECLSATGAVIWELLAVPRGLPELVTMLASGYGDSTEAIRSDVEGFLRPLFELGLLEEAATGEDGSSREDRDE